MGPRQQLLAGLVIAALLLLVGLVRAHRRGCLFTAEGKVEYGYVLKLIPLTIVFASGIVSVILTFVFFARWASYEDPPSGPTLPLDAFMPPGYSPHYVMALVIIGALVAFSLSLMGYMDHVNAGGKPTKARDADTDEDESSARAE